jgi:catechol 2,3-dioxygenase-like lactoylglutathione lyase family enzyme
MKPDDRIEAVNHVGIVVTDLRAAEEFYTGLLGFPPHPAHPSWLLLNEHSSLHLIEIPEAREDEAIFREVQHVAFQVPSLGRVRELALEHGRRAFQMDFEGNQREISSASDDLSFGIGTIFVPDPAGNLLEFLEVGRGVFTREIVEAAVRRTRDALGERPVRVSAINHACMLVGDAEEARQFYGSVLGLSRDPRDPDGDWFTVTRSTSIHTAPAPEVNEDPSWIHRMNHFALEVEHAAAVHALLRSRGLNVFRIVEQDADRIDVACAAADMPIYLAGESFFVYDPDGNLIEFGDRKAFQARPLQRATATT